GAALRHEEHHRLPLHALVDRFHLLARGRIRAGGGDDAGQAAGEHDAGEHGACQAARLRGDTRAEETEEAEHAGAVDLRSRHLTGSPVAGPSSAQARGYFPPPTSAGSVSAGLVTVGLASAQWLSQPSSRAGSPDVASLVVPDQPCAFRGENDSVMRMSADIAVRKNSMSVKTCDTTSPPSISLPWGSKSRPPMRSRTVDATSRSLAAGPRR